MRPRTLERARLAGHRAAEEMQADALVRVLPVDRLDLVSHLRLDAELLGDLAAEGLIQRLAWVGLAAGEFPEAREMRARRAARDQDRAVPVDHRGDDLDDYQVSQWTSSERGSRRRATEGGGAARSGSM